MDNAVRSATSAAAWSWPATALLRNGPNCLVIRCWHRRGWIGWRITPRVWSSPGAASARRAIAVRPASRRMLG